MDTTLLIAASVPTLILIGIVVYMVRQWKNSKAA